MKTKTKEIEKKKLLLGIQMSNVQIKYADLYIQMSEEIKPLVLQYKELDRQLAELQKK